jgi:alpha-1,3-rhamnosyl/mannosyltransferase
MSENKIQLIYDLSTYRPEKRTGVGVYMEELLRRLPKSQIDIIPSLKLSHWLQAKEVNAAIRSLLAEPLKVEIFKPWRFSVPANSIYHSPDFRLSLRAPGLKRIVTVHDMLVFEGKYSDPVFDEVGKKDMNRLFKTLKPDAVIANSYFSQSEIIKYFPEYKDKVYVTHLGCDRLNAAAADLGPSMLELPDKYFFFLGTLEIRKNILGMIKAYEIFRRSGGREKLILCGHWGYGESEIKKTINNSPFSKDIIHLQKITDGDCVKLFKKATAFFFPSLYEGFGIPVLEAMKMNCPVVTSNTGALAEVVGDASLQANPENHEELASNLIDICKSPELRAQLVLKGQERVKEFTWDRCAEQTLEVYKKVLGLA